MNKIYLYMFNTVTVNKEVSFNAYVMFEQKKNMPGRIMSMIVQDTCLNYQLQKKIRMIYEKIIGTIFFF